MQQELISSHLRNTTRKPLEKYDTFNKTGTNEDVLISSEKDLERMIVMNNKKR